MDVLIIVDDPDLSGMLTEVSALEGMRPHPVAEPDRGDVLLAGLRMDVGLIDLALHGERDAHAALAVARAIRAWAPRLPLVALAASVEEHERAEEAGLFAVILDKPFGVDDLNQTVRDAARGAA